MNANRPYVFSNPLTHSFHQRLEKQVQHLKDENLFREVREFQNYRLNLSGNDYFQLRFHPQVLAGARQAAENFGSGSGASPLLSGFLPCHRKLLETLCEWKHKPCGMLFNTGFLANQAVLKHLPGKNDLVLADKLIHHSIAQALVQGQARFKRYHHLDLDHLRELLEKYKSEYETIFVVTESVFSMDGDHPDLDRLVELKHKVPFILVLDEAHGTGAYGPAGGGLAEEMNVLDEIDILVGTLGKALASAGAYVLAASQTVVDYLTNHAGEYIYSTFLSPAQVGAATSAIEILRQGTDKRQALRAMSRKFRCQLDESRWETNDFDSPIVPVVVGEADETLKLRDHLLKHGYLVGAVRPPTVPRGTSRLRVSLHSEVTESELNDLLTAMNQWKKN
ncbi:MAG: 8-amino-7-oxononanoate synthase [Nitrospinaceae bacterium]|nr:MAG: 8-amino-7-oxononanoate synthase [Nitrospinaceae bacterium]